MKSTSHTPCAGEQAQPEAISVVLLNKRELAALLAAAALYEQRLKGVERAIDVREIASDNGNFEALNAEELAALSERMNFGRDDGHAANVACIMREVALQNETRATDTAIIDAINCAAVALTLLEREAEGNLWEIHQADWESVCFSIARRILHPSGAPKEGWEQFIRGLLN